MTGRNAMSCAVLLLCAALCGCRERPAGKASAARAGDAASTASPDARPAPAAAGGAVPGALPSTGNAALDAALGPFRLGPPACARNLAVVPILAALRRAHDGDTELVEGVAAATREADADYLTLAEALEKKVVSIKELQSGGSVPTLQMTSSASRPVLIPFGAIVTGGKQDRMIRDDIVLRPKEQRTVAVYCIEQGRWSAGAGGQAFAWSANYGSNHVRIASNLNSPQTVIWSSVAAQNHALDNLTDTGNFQGNFETKAFKDSSAELDPVRKAIESLENVCGAVAVVNGEVTGAEICAGPEYFRKLWPQLFAGYVVDASSAREKNAVDANQAAEAARAYMAAIGSAKVATEQKEPQLRVSIEAENALGGATIEPGSGRLIYLRFFPKPKAAAHEGVPRGDSSAGQEVIQMGGHVQWVADPPANERPALDQVGSDAGDGPPSDDPPAPGR